MHKSLFVHFSIALAILLLPNLASAETWYVKKSAAKLPDEASARSEVLGKIQKGTPFKVKKKSGKFFQVSSSAKMGSFYRFKLTKKPRLAGREVSPLL